MKNFYKFLLIIVISFFCYLGLNHLGFLGDNSKERPDLDSFLVTEAKFLQAWEQVYRLRLNMQAHYMDKARSPESMEELMQGKTEVKFVDYIEKIVVNHKGIIRADLAEEHFGENAFMRLEPVENSFSGHWACTTNVPTNPMSNACETL